MTNYRTTWYDGEKIANDHIAYPCRQVYVWLVTADGCIIIVSRDGKNWQLPGGKPEQGETLTGTAIREIYEETSLDISSTSERLRFFGYRTVCEIDQDEREVAIFTQVRFILRLTENASELNLSAEAEDTTQAEKNCIHFVKTVPILELTQHIPWLKDSPEYIAASKHFDDDVLKS